MTCVRRLRGCREAALDGHVTLGMLQPAFGSGPSVRLSPLSAQHGLLMGGTQGSPRILGIVAADKSA